ncbi:peroxisome biogenesis factor 10 isoform X2 [Leucoraja erinacea]|uniref:peroxisome biogenesis factor 10 isoform X2 n=1 Tax=Leucoraja erinaceus TaxID=7782 RepID=UPI0024566870|nr:peroxisome biogenesis factor 10 isoform X2 [Leucoraja erinacea]
MAVLPVNQPHFIRSNQKDEYYLGSLRSCASDVFQIFAGARRWLEWRKEVELLVELAYFSLTTFAGFQTLGEEYVNIVQVDSSGRRVPSRGRRAALIVLHTCVPYLLDRGLVRLELHLQTASEGFRPQDTRWLPARSRFSQRLQSAISRLSDQQRKALLQAIYLLRQVVSFLHRLHLGIFYLNGSYYHIAKRFTSISYKFLAGSPSPQLPLYTVFGRTTAFDSDALRPPLLLGVHHGMVQHKSRMSSLPGDVPAPTTNLLATLRLG